MVPKESIDPKLHSAALAGLGGFRGEEEVANDLGIPTTPEDVASHIKSGRKAAELLLAATQKSIQSTSVVSDEAMTAPDAEEHAQVVDALGPPPEVVDGTEYIR